MRKTLTIIIISAACMTAAACNTVRGVGQDIESVANAADRAI